MKRKRYHHIYFLYVSSGYTNLPSAGRSDCFFMSDLTDLQRGQFVSAIRELFWDGPRNSEQRSDDRGCILGAASSLQTSAPHQREDVWPTTLDLACTGPTSTVDLEWNRDCELEPSGFEAETLTLGHRRLQ
ncbi:hypothetical protein AVEN_153386-1 [Araneus ventricosus]|uniref:Uncharacterized protein n=1 Tax=Araneus ventricosus TaxID=182803 RepID=A0A4Y2FT30_ARAVE|nr:hypothetical protein AVEN_153386-1 [Araneus ventricosus]